MSDRQTHTPPTPLPGEQGQHFELIKQAIPDCLINSSPERRQALKQTPVNIHAWYDAASQAQKDQLKTLLQMRCESMIELEKSFGKVQSVEAFAQPLLTAALKTAGHELDVNQIYLRLYFPVEDAFGVRTHGYTTKTFSLLQAALGNFEAREAVEDFFNSTSGFITAPDAQGHFERHATSLKIHEFAQLCRTLDLGAKYQAHLTALLEPEDALARKVFRERYIGHQKDAFKAAAYMALLKGDIGTSDHALLLRVAAGEQHIMVGTKQLWYRSVNLMNLHLHDCLIIDPCARHHYSSWIIVYIPEDPDHPIKRYESFNDFRNDLTDRLTASVSQTADRSKGWLATRNQRFFGEFVADKDRPYYYRRLTELVVDAPPQPFGAEWLRSEWGRFITELLAPPFSTISSTLGEPRSTARVPVRAPEYNIHPEAINGIWGHVDLWTHRYASLRKRLYDDARNQAVPTADADEASRSRRTAHYLSIGMFGLNLAAMAIPPLGVAMAVVMAGQLFYEVVEGAIELSQGDREAGWAHITDVLENLATLAAGAAAFHFTVSPFVEELKAVTLPSGKTRLWKPDLTAYEHPRAIPAGVAADELGLYKVDGNSVLALEGKHYAVHKDTAGEGYRITHPVRAEAYQPRLTDNGSGLWNHELERPLNWEGASLMRRLGPVTEGFSDAELEQVRWAANVSEDVLRRVHVEGETVPAILLDTLRQFRAYRDAVKVAEGIRAGALSSELCSYAASLAVELPRWPASKAIEAFSGTDLSGPSIKYGNSQASASDTLRIHRGDLMTGQLPRRIAETLSEPQLIDLVGRSNGTPEARTTALQALLEQQAISVRSRLMHSIYLEQQPVSDAAIMLVQRDFSGLPTILARELLADATPAEKEVMRVAKRIPLRLAQKARLAQQQMRLTLAYEGLHLDAMVDADTEALALNTLQRLPGWTDNLRLEVREGRFAGELRASFGPEDAAERKVLVRVGEGRYQARNAQDEDLHSIDDLYASIQHALTDRHRQALGLPHIKQGAALKAKIIEHALPREQLRQLLKMQPRKRPFFKAPMRLSGERLGYPLSGRGQPSFERQVRSERVHSLYPTFSEGQVNAFIDRLGLSADSVLRALEREYKQLNSTLQRWQVEQLNQDQSAAGFAARRGARLSIIRALKQAWQRTGEEDLGVTGASQGQFIDLSGLDLCGQLAELPPLNANFDHVTHLDLSGASLKGGIDTFLSYFNRLRRLALNANALTQLPGAIGDMTRLTELTVSENQIVLDQPAVDSLRGLTRLKLLALDDNPLALPVDISQMPDLQILMLGGTGLTTWPTGVFAQVRGIKFYLDLSGNRLEQIPVVSPGSAQAQTVARTQISHDAKFISAQNLQTYKDYRVSVGMDPNRISPPRGSQDSIQWNAGLSEEQWLAKQDTWNRLEYEHGSEPFFDEIRKLGITADAVVQTEAVKAELAGKVWQMIEAAADDTALREKLFQMAAAPTSCEDAGAQLFNAMGLEVLTLQAYQLGAHDLIELRLLELARGKSRLDELGRIAQARVNELVEEGMPFPQYDEQGRAIAQYDAQGREVETIDEVEIHLIYPTRLAERLDLPWQSRQMKYAEDNVQPSMIEDAYERLVELEEGELLAQRIAEQPLWRDFLYQTESQPFNALHTRATALLDALDAPQPISQAQYDADLALIAAEEKALFVTSTEQAIVRTGLLRIEPPQNRK